MCGGLRTGPVISAMLKRPKLKKYARMYLMSRGIKQYQKSTFDDAYQYWQAGKGVGNIKSVESVETVVQEFRKAYAEIGAVEK